MKVCTKEKRLPVPSTADITTENSNSDAAVKEVTFSIHEEVYVIEDDDKDDNY